MILRFDDRTANSGFTLLEALIALALLVLVLSTAIPAVTGAAARQAGRLNALHATEFAASVFEEYRVTFPQMETVGEDESGWNWQIAETPVAPDGRTSLDSAMQLIEMRLTVWHRDRTANKYDFTSLVARPTG